MRDKNGWGAAFRATLPVMAGYLVLGFGFGVLMHTRGYGLPWSAGMSLFVYAGTLQFVAVDLLSGGASLLTAGVTALLVNARHLFYGLSMLERYRSAGRRKPYMIFALTDETYSLVCAAPERDARFIFRVSLLDQCWWVAGSVLGSLAGALIPFDSRGIDFSLTALFLTVVADQWRDKANRGPALVGLGVTAVCLGLFGPESFLLPSMGGILVLLLVLFRGREGGAAHD